MTTTAATALRMVRGEVDPARVQPLDGDQAVPGPGPRHALPAEGVFWRLLH